MARANVAADPLHWWNPRKIILQIILLQLAYTIVATLLVSFIVLVMGAPYRLGYIFLASRFRSDNVFGWSLSFLSIITAGLMYVLLSHRLHRSRILALVMIVRRSQLIIDFVLTLQFFHLLFTALYDSGFRMTMLWWSTKVAETLIMIFGGRYFCRMRELQPIEFGTYEMVPTRDIERQDAPQQNGVIAQNEQSGGS